MARISFEIKICSVSDDDNHKEIKGNKNMVINDIEYNFIKKCLNKEYGIGFEFDELDAEIDQVTKDFNNK